MQRTWIELDQQAFDSNIANLATALAPTDLALVVKSNAYGHGIQQIAQLAQYNTSIKWLCTAGLQEAVYLRTSCQVTKPLLVLSYLEGDLQAAAHYAISCAVYTHKMALDISKAAVCAGKTIPVHVKIDTGMSRLGSMCKDTPDFLHILASLPGITVQGIFTHLADPTNYAFSMYQLEQFNTVISLLDRYTTRPPIIHALSSSGLALNNMPAAYTLVRAGALAYGLHKSPQHQMLIHTNYPSLMLRPIMTWKSSIVQIKQLPKDSYVGYNLTYKTERETTVALLPVGYNDGYPRALSNRAYALVKKQKAPILGIVSMNLIAIDITDIPGVTYTDQVTLMGPDINLVELSTHAHSITNELATRICNSIERVIIPSQEYHLTEYSPALSGQATLDKL